jgi:hypothetical protein
MIGMLDRLVAAAMVRLATLAHAGIAALMTLVGLMGLVALRARLMALIALMLRLAARLMARMVARLTMIRLAVIRLAMVRIVARLAMVLAAVHRPTRGAGDEGRQIALDILAALISPVLRPLVVRPVILLKSAAALAWTLIGIAPAAVAAAPRPAMRALIRLAKARAGLRLAGPGIAHALAIAAIAVVRLAHARRVRPARRISLVSHRLSLSFCASRRITMDYGKE